MSRFSGLSGKLGDAGTASAAEPPEATPARAPAQNGAVPAERRPARAGKKFVGGWYSKEMSRELGYIALDNDTTLQALVGEALDLLLRKYGKHPRNER